MTGLKSAIEDARWQDEIKSKETIAILEGHAAEHSRIMSNASSWLKKISPTNKDQYILWLDGFCKAGGKITHVYDYEFPKGFFVAREDLTITELFGASAVNVIIPNGTKCEIEEIGHNNIYYMDDFKCSGRWVPIYKGF